MTARDLFSQLEITAVGRAHFFGRKLVTIRKEDWLPYQKHFLVSYNPLNQITNYRTTQPFTHIHAIEVAGYIDFHLDFFNPDANRLLAIPHFFVSVLPYCLWHILTWKKMYAIHKTKL